MESMFSNTQIDLQQIPKLEDLEFNPISKNYLTLLIFQRVVFLVLVGIGACFANLFLTQSEPRLLVNSLVTVVIVIGLLNMVVAILGFKKRQYAIRERDIVYKKGLLVAYQTVVSFKRIQHIELQQSFVAKKWDVATLNIFTAGESGGDLKIKGLQTDTAVKINEFLSSKVNDTD